MDRKKRAGAHDNLGLFDSQRAPTQNVRCPASITDRRDNCLLLTQDVGFFLKGSKRAGAPIRSPIPHTCQAARTPLRGNHEQDEHQQREYSYDGAPPPLCTHTVLL
jgi:hypothetical protein